VIRDYKSKIVIKNRPRRRSHGRAVLLLSATALLASAFLIRHVDLAAGQSERSEQIGTISVSLPLPSRPLVKTALGTREKLNPSPENNDPGLRALPLRKPVATAENGTATVATLTAEQRATLPYLAESHKASEATEPAWTDATASMPAATQTIGKLINTAAAADRSESAQAIALKTVETPFADPATLLEPVTETPPHAIEHRVQRGDTLAKIFSDADLSPSLLHRIVKSSDIAAQLAKIRPGQDLRLLFNRDDELAGLTLQRNRVSSLRIMIQDGEITATEHREDLERRIAQATGVIESSLFVDGQKAGLDDDLIMELAAIFGWDIDFALEIRAGDRFSVVYEELFLGEEKIRNGDILAAEFVNRGNEHRALRFATSDGDEAYYDSEGRNKRRAFIRTPVKFARVSSRFTNRRWHPVLKRWRSHKGVDYAAPRGTPIKAAGAGRVVFKGRKGGYGRVIFIEHAQKYTTVYGHMSRYAKSLKTGSRVKQGQVIGYVGKSGLATGPHLHYEFRVNGVHRNPLTVKLPKSLPLPKRELAAFRRETQPLLATLNKLSRSTLIAEADPR
jgi:murein DD-endopeptidase MepM/ murein hydrolase activator NlpD